ncbi:hypothetical protein ACFOWE_17605 [Planomonospora corallina]|uniref:Uncharacterized protein n=1 Tax=Planomonospora corallina TaxID=1806052 RepID=A0ABV8I812_9ACTN
MGEGSGKRSGAARLALWHGAFNVLSGVWPLVHLPSFEKVSGPKEDDWLVRTVGGLLAGIGWSQLRGAATAEGRVHARRVGVATAATLAVIDVVYVARRRIRPVYLLDAAVEAAWIVAWWRAGAHGNGGGPQAPAVPSGERRSVSA